MKVLGIQAFTPIFTSSIKRADNTSFVTKPDSFEKSPFDFDLECEKFHKKLQKSLDIQTPSNIIQKAKLISHKTGVKENDVYKIMGMLTEYGSYKSFNKIESVLDKQKIHIVSNMNRFDCPQIANNPSIYLTNVMHYISRKNIKCMSNIYEKDYTQKALFVDKNFLDTVKNMPDKKGFYENYLKKNNIKLLYFENFENGYNFLTQDESLEAFTIKTIEKAKKFQQKNGKDIFYNIKYVLNGENIKAIKDLNLKVNIIRSPLNNYTPEKIADNINPIIPDVDDIKSIISEIIHYNRNFRSNETNQKEILKFLDKTMAPISPKEYNKQLKHIHKNLLKYLKDTNRTMDDVYFVIPATDKSFSIANYLYMKTNNIKNPKFIFLKENGQTNFSKLKPLLLAPKNSVFVLIDDCIITGLSMKQEVFPYTKLGNKLFENKNIVFAPIVAAYSGVKCLESAIKDLNRDDKIICGKILPKYKNTTDLLTTTFDTNSKSETTTSITLPYMGPDFNCEELVPLYEKFFYSPSAQKTTVNYINSFMYT